MPITNKTMLDSCTFVKSTCHAMDRSLPSFIPEIPSLHFLAYSISVHNPITLAQISLLTQLILNPDHITGWMPSEIRSGMIENPQKEDCI